MIGFLNIIKPTGVSSGYVVNKIKHKLGMKVGHLGTLDPLASGVLPIAVSKATRLFDYFLKKDKEYFAIMKFGKSTDTLDSEGEVIRTDNKQITLEDIERVLPNLIGEVMQTPPLYSSISVGGKHAYELAKQNNKIQLEARKTQIYSIYVEKWHQNNTFKLRIHCAAGTYVRSIVRDIGIMLDASVTTVAIVRTRSGAFDIQNAITIEEADESKIIRVKDVLKLEKLSLTQQDAKKILDGKKVYISMPDGEYLCLLNDDEFSLAEIKNGELISKIYLYEKEAL